MKRIAKQVAVGSALILFLFSVRGATDAPRTAFSPSQGTPEEIAALYDKQCAKCHGKDGRAKSFRAKMTGARNFTDAEWHARVSDATLAASIADGRGSMPSFKKKLSDDQIKSLVAYVRRFKKQ